MTEMNPLSRLYYKWKYFSPHHELLFRIQLFQSQFECNIILLFKPFKKILSLLSIKGLIQIILPISA